MIGFDSNATTQSKFVENCPANMNETKSYVRACFASEMESGHVIGSGIGTRHVSQIARAYEGAYGGGLKTARSLESSREPCPKILTVVDVRPAECVPLESFPIEYAGDMDRLDRACDYRPFTREQCRANVCC